VSKSLPLSVLLSAMSTGHGTVKWHDEATQQAPLSPVETQWSGDEELEILLGEQIWAARNRLKHRVAHWMSDGNLLAVVDADGWRVSLRPQVAKSLLGEARFVMRPATASTPPEAFRGLSMDDVLWMFGLYGAQSPGALPVKYLTAPLQLKKIPVLGTHRMARRHYSLMRLLGAQALTFEALREMLSANREDLQRDLVALYLVRAIEPKPKSR
jgi:hypothetical protein